jgi:hypothetical protein
MTVGFVATFMAIACIVASDVGAYVVGTIELQLLLFLREVKMLYLVISLQSHSKTRGRSNSIKTYFRHDICTRVYGFRCCRL